MAYMVLGEIAGTLGRSAQSHSDWLRASELLTPRLKGSSDWHLLDPAARAAERLDQSDEARAMMGKLNLLGYVPLEPWLSLDHRGDAKN
jgi:uncharacterized protein HemY